MKVLHPCSREPEHRGMSPYLPPALRPLLAGRILELLGGERAPMKSSGRWQPLNMRAAVRYAAMA